LYIGVEFGKIETNEMGRACGTYGRDREVHSVLVGKPEGKRHWEDQDVDGRIILGWIFKTLEGVVWTG
jgi:hypothetical protein